VRLAALILTAGTVTHFEERKNTKNEKNPFDPFDQISRGKTHPIHTPLSLLYPSLSLS
jgi:hypothetical protein